MRRSCTKADKDVLLDYRIALGVACAIPGIGRTVNLMQNEQMAQVILTLDALTATAATQTASIAALTATAATQTAIIAALTENVAFLTRQIDASSSIAAPEAKLT